MKATFVTQYTSNQLPLSPALLLVVNTSTNVQCYQSDNLLTFHDGKVGKARS